LLTLTVRLNAITFDFIFDNDPTPGIQPPLIGSGTFTFANDPGDGTFAFAGLGSFSMTFSLLSGSSVFTQADILSDLSLATVVLSTSGFGRVLRFSDTGAGSGGPFAGSLDLINLNGDALTFEPSYFGEGLRLYQAANSTAILFGDYSAVHGVPESGSTVTLLAFVAFGLTFIGRTRKFVET
jgi:hypothetical protein